MTSELPRLHAVTTTQILTLPDLEERARTIGRTPDVALHVRSREMPGRNLARVAARLRETTEPRGASVFVNDRADVALLSAASGVHLPAGGLAVDKVRDLVGPDLWIGRSTHTAEEALRAMDDGADYVFLGPVWETPSHPGRPALGPGAIEAAHPARVIAIGGVTPDRVASCVGAGAYGIAAVSALWYAEDPGSAAATMLLLLKNN